MGNNIKIWENLRNNFSCKKYTESYIFIKIKYNKNNVKWSKSVIIVLVGNCAYVDTSLQMEI